MPETTAQNQKTPAMQPIGATAETAAPAQPTRQVEVARPGVTTKSELLNAARILNEEFLLTPGEVIADLGAGGGMFVTNEARIVGEQGQAYAVDVVKGNLSEIESKARIAGLTNIKTVWSNLEILGATKIKEASLDAATIVNVLYQSKKHQEILTEAARLLKPNGRLMIIDWMDTAPAFAPPANLKVNQAKLREIAQGIGLRLDKEFKAGQYHFGMIFIKE